MSSVPKTKSGERVIDVEGVAIAVTEFPHPDRPPLVLLHGIGSRGQSWWPVIDPLAERFHCYQIDLRGHGASGKPESGYAIETFVADLAAVIDALELEAPRVMGHSLGALVTLLWAGEHPTRAAALVLEDPPLRTEPEILDAFDGWQQLAAMSPEAAAAWYQREYPHWSADDCLRRAQTITSTAPGVFRELRAASAATLANGDIDRTARLSAVRSPALLVRGNPELGGRVPKEDAARFLTVLPAARVATIAEAGHALHRDAAAAFLAEVVPFLENPPACRPERREGSRTP